MRSIRSRFIAIVALAGKEIREVARQPRLLLVLVLGPFIILGLFGLGYETSPAPKRTLLVVPGPGDIADRIDEIQEALEPTMDVVGVVEDEEEARQRLLDREVDLVVVAPAHPVETIRSGEHARVGIVHDTLDPFEAAYIGIFSRASIDDLNRHILQRIATEAQDRLASYDDALPAAQEAAEDLTVALRTGDSTSARLAIVHIDEALTQTGLGRDEAFISEIDQQLGNENPELGPVAEARAQLDEIDVDDPDSVSRAEELQETLAEVEEAAQEVQQLSPEVLVRPFVAEAEQVVGTEIPTTTFYSPGVAVVLIQHIMLTFAALSLVREESLGTTELFRVAPVGTLSVLAGKYLGYFVIGAVTAAALVAGIVFVFGTPMAGDWSLLALIMGLTILASLGLGFAITSASNSDSQAVQFSMMALLFTIFFSGFVVTLERLSGLTRVVAHAVPATSSIGAMQDIMFRGDEPRLSLVLGLAVYALVGLIAGWWGLRRRLQRG